jgi:hypothetical protein
LRRFHTATLIVPMLRSDLMDPSQLADAVLASTGA